MNVKQEKFCRIYLTNLNVAEAAKKAGYNPTTGYKLMKQPEIKQYIAEQLEEIKSDQIAEVKELLEMLTAVSRDEKADMKHRIKATELLGKTYGIFKTKEQPPNYPTVIITGADMLED